MLLKPSNCFKLASKGLFRTEAREMLALDEKRRFAWKAQRFRARDTGGHDAWLDLKTLHRAVVILLPIGRSTFQQLQPRHARDHAIGVKDRVDERIGGERSAVLKARNGRCARPRALGDFSLRRAGALAGGT
jgi:hypothetical protein